MNMVFMGTPHFAAVCLEKLVEAGHDVKMVITQPDKAKDRGKKIKATPVKEMAIKYEIPVMQPERVRGNDELIAELRDIAPEIIIVAAYGQILPKELLEIPKFGCVNVHASLLPKFRGAAPIQRAIMEGEELTGVTIMKMAEGLDTGDMISKVEVPIEKKNFEELHDELARKGAELLIETLKDIEGGRASFEKQDDSMASYAHMIEKKDGHIDFSQSAESIERLIRAFNPLPGAYAIFNDKGESMKFFAAEPLKSGREGSQNGEIIEVDNNYFTVSCADGVLKVTEIQVPGKKRCRVADYLRGNSLETGFIFR